MLFLESIRVCFVKFATFSGRASRSEFWYFTLFLGILGLCTEVVDAALAGESFWGYSFQLGPVTTISYIVTILPASAVTFRRLQDLDKSGWWCLILITGIGLIPLTYWNAAKGIQGPNRYGDDPLKHLRDEDIGKNTPKWINYFLIPVGLIIFGFGFLMLSLEKTGIMVIEDKVFTGQELQDSSRSELIDNQLLNPDEEILFFYTMGFLSIVKDGQLMTDKRVTTYEVVDGIVEVGSMLLENIKEVTLIEEGGFLNDVYKITGNDAAEYEAIIIHLPHGDENSKNFIDKLEAQIRLN